MGQQIQNSEVLTAIRNASKMQGTNIPNFLSNNVIPTIEVNPQIVKIGKCISGVASNATSAVLLPAQADKDVYIVGVSLGVIKDVTATSTNSAVAFTDENGASYNLISIPGITLTVQNLATSANFSHPIKIKRNTAVNITNTTAVGNVLARASLYYFEDESTNG